jgi:hypothetical protein
MKTIEISSLQTKRNGRKWMRKLKEDLAIFVSNVTNRVICSRFADIGAGGGESLSIAISPTAQSMKPNGGKGLYILERLNADNNATSISTTYGTAEGLQKEVSNGNLPHLFTTTTRSTMAKPSGRETTREIHFGDEAGREEDVDNEVVMGGPLNVSLYLRR